MRTALYFGSFNPLHEGHKGIALYLSSLKQVDQVRFILSPKNPHKEVGILADPHKRLADLVSEIEMMNNPKIILSDVEFHLTPPLYTINTLRHIRDTEPENEQILIMGADNLASIEKWHGWMDILTEFEIWVYPREGYEPHSLAERYNMMDKRIRISVLDAPLFNISSTEIRNGVISKV